MSFENYTQNITAGKVLKFALLPDFKSRFRDLGVNLSWFVTFFAWFFFEAGLIEKNHPCLRPENNGKYGFRDIIALAFSNIQWDRKHIPQILLFVAVIASIAISIVFIFTALFYYLVTFAHAQSSITSEGLFSLPQLPGTNVQMKPEDEYALQFLSRVFGNTGIGAFDPNEASTTYSWLTIALQNMLEFYSNVLLYVGGFIVLYYIVMLVVEAAHTGKPLGGRYSPWAPVRLALGIALLVPFSANGYNGAQLVVFQSMAWGSNLATNIWVTALNAYAGQCGTTGQNCMIGEPHVENNAEFVRGLFLINVCQQAYNDTMAKAGVGRAKYLIKERTSQDTTQNATVYTYGVKANQDYCGSYRITNPPNSTSNTTYCDDGGNNIICTGTQIPENQPFIDIQKGYEEGYQFLLNGGSGVKSVPVKAAEIVDILLPAGDLVHEELYTPDKLNEHIIRAWLVRYQHTVDAAVTIAVGNQNIIADAVLKNGAAGGWANAGSFYMTLSRLNGSIQSAVSNSPEIIKLPEILTGDNASPYSESPNTYQVKEKYLEQIHLIMQRAAHWWDNYPMADGTENEVGTYGYAQIQNASAGSATGRDGSVDANSVANFFTGPIFGGGGWIVVKDTLNPMAELTTLGGILVAIALGAMVAGAVIPGIGTIIMLFGMAFFSAGIALWIVLPLLPFFYFTFGVVNWVIAVFEAIVGAPLWALSFLKIDGAGLPGGGMNGIYLIFLLFLHPTLMIFGLFGSILVFSAAITFLNSTFSIVTESIMADRSGMGHGISGLAFIIAYVVIIYMMGQSIFKMIDTIPKKISRFMTGGDKSTFSELSGDSGGFERALLVMATTGTSIGNAAPDATSDTGKGIKNLWSKIKGKG